MFNLQLDANNVFSALSHMPEQIPFAAALALTRTAQKVKRDLQTAMPVAFKNPTPYTLRGVSLDPATKRKLEAIVWLKGDGMYEPSNESLPQAKYLRPGIFGGPRHAKSNELDMRRAGFLSGDMFTAPAYEFKGKLDKYGNIPGPTILQMITSLGIQQERPGWRQNSTRESRARNSRRRLDYFVMRRNNKDVGIFRRKPDSDDAETMLWFIKAPVYKKRFDFFGIANKAVHENLMPEIQSAMQVALATARV